jgi:NodT family efflux transporter outer membrane factor (OMF) lipoprotein
MRSLAWALAASAFAVALAGCTVGPNYHRPSVPTAPAWRDAPPPNPPNGSWQHAHPAAAALRGQWWRVYNDPRLDRLEQKVAVSNQTLRAAMENYFAAREQVRVARSQYFPTLAAGPSFQRTRNSYNQANASKAFSNLQYNTFSLGGQAQWEPDIWGQVRRSVEAARATAQASAAELASVELSLQAELASDYFSLRGLDLQKQLLDDTVRSYQSYLHLTQIRFRGGVATESDVALAQTQLDATRAQDIDVSVARAQYEHAIATLIGVPPSTFSLPPMPLAGLPPQIPAGIPSQLLQRRPDISAAERQIDAANAQIGITEAAWYPNLSLTGTGGLLSGRAGTWIQGPSEMWSLGASAMELLFDGGRRRAVTRQARDYYQEQTANYRQVVLSAFQEVEDDLSALRILRQEAAADQQAVASARRSLALSTTSYKGGVVDYLQVLTAQTAQLSSEQAQAGVVTRRFIASVDLIRALGGGWNTGKLPKM